MSTSAWSVCSSGACYHAAEYTRAPLNACSKPLASIRVKRLCGAHVAFVVQDFSLHDHGETISQSLLPSWKLNPLWVAPLSMDLQAACINNCLGHQGQPLEAGVAAMRTLDSCHQHLPRPIALIYISCGST